MKLWRVHWHTDAGNSAGYEWFTTKRAAKAKIDEIVDRDAITDASGDMPDLESFDIEVSAKGVLNALNTHGGHPDNG